MLATIALDVHSAGKVAYKIKDSGSRFESTDAAQQAAAVGAAQLVDIAQTRYGIALDGSELSVIELQKLAERVRAEYLAVPDAAEQSRQRDEWVRLFGSYFGELLVKHRGAVWGKTDWMGGDERALGYPKHRGISLPYDQMSKAFTWVSSICGWYIIATSGEGGALPPAIAECDARGFKKTPEEEDRAAKTAAWLKQREEDDLKQRATQRTAREINLALYRVQSRAADAFHDHHAKSPARFSFGFTVAPDGAVTEAHKINADFDDPALEQELLDLVRGLKFEARAVSEYVHPGSVFAYRED